MAGVQQLPFAASLSEWLAGTKMSSVLLVAGLLLVVLIVAIVVAVARGIRFRDELRSIVQALEQLRSGRGRGHTEVSDGSRLGLLADAVQRLGVDLHSSWTEAETAAERWRALSDATRDTAIITTDTDGDIRSFSAGATALTGWEESEMIARPAAVLFAESAYKDLLPKLTRQSLRSKGVRTRSVFTRRDGSSFEVEVVVRLLISSASKPVGFMMLVRDVSEQVRLEGELRDSEQRYRGLIEGLGEGVLIVQGGQLVYANPAAESLFGSRSSQLTGRPLRDRVATAEVLLVESALRAVADGVSPRETLACTLLDEERAPRAAVRLTATPIDYSGAPAVMLLVQDETLEHQVTRELRRNEACLDAVLESAVDGLLVLTDDPGRMVQVTNRAFAEMFNLSVEALLGASEEQLTQLLELAGPGGAELAEVVRQSHSGTEMLAFEGVEGKELQARVSDLPGPEGERLGRVIACRDVTRQRQSERELQEQAEKLQLGKVELEQSLRRLNEIHAELKSRSDELETVNHELTRLDQMKSDLIGNVSHELQTPLVSIRGYTEMILKERLGPINEEQRKGLALSLKNIDRLIAMIDNLLAFSRSDSSLRELELSRFGLVSLIAEARELLRDQIERKKLRFEVKAEAAELRIEADRDKILQVLLNLLSNAVKYSVDGGRVTVEALRGSDGHASVTVKDEGAGIPTEALGKIFDRHYQAPARAEGRPPGSGIGLSIVRDILRLHGCTIRVVSEEGKGAEFTFTLPLAEEMEEPTPAPEPLPTPEPAPPAEATEPPEPTAAPQEPPASDARPRLRIIRRYKMK
jgi:PAS domain S-box-containing protein